LEGIIEAARKDYPTLLRENLGSLSLAAEQLRSTRAENYSPECVEGAF